MGTPLAFNKYSWQNTSSFSTEQEYHITSEPLKYKIQNQLCKSGVLKLLNCLQRCSVFLYSKDSCMNSLPQLLHSLLHCYHARGHSLQEVLPHGQSLQSQQEYCITSHKFSTLRRWPTSAHRCHLVQDNYWHHFANAHLSRMCTLAILCVYGTPGERFPRNDSLKYWKPFQLYPWLNTDTLKLFSDTILYFSEQQSLIAQRFHCTYSLHKPVIIHLFTP